MADEHALRWDEKALEIVTQIERAIVHQRLPAQGQFVALTNALEMQIESGDPEPKTVEHLCEVLLCLARARGLDLDQARLPNRLEKLRKRLARQGSTR